MSNRRRQVRSLLALSGLAFGLAFSALAGAAVPTIDAQVSGECPSALQLDRALTAALADDPGAGPSGPYRLVIQHLKGDELRARLLDDHGTMVIERVLASSDCVSLAEAIAIVVRAHFLQLGLDEREKEYVLQDAEDRARPGDAPPKATEAPQIRESSKEGVEVSEAPEHAHEPARWLISGGVSGELFLPQGELSPGGNLGVGLSWKYLRARLQGFGSLPYRLGQGEDEIQRTPAGALLGLSYITAGRVKWEAGVAAGAGVSWLVPTTVSAPRHGSVASPVLGGELRLLLQASQSWRPWFGSYARYGLIREEYAIIPRGVVGRGPTLVLGLTLGADLVLGTRR